METAAVLLPSKENVNPNLRRTQELIVDILSGHKTHSFEDLSISIKALLSTNKDLPFAVLTATKLFEFVTQKLQYNLTVSTPNPLVLDTLLHDISTLLRLFFDLESFIKLHNPSVPVELKCTKNLFRHLLGYVGSKDDLETQDRLLIDLLRVIINPPSAFTSSFTEAQLISVIEEEISEFEPSIYLALSRIFQFLDKKAIMRLCNDPMELLKGILDSIEDIESPIFHDICRFLYSIHLNPHVQKALLRSEIHMILYKLLQIPYQDFKSQGGIPKPFHKTRILCIQIIVDCVSVQSEDLIAEFVINLLRSDVKYLADSKRQLFIDEVMKPLLKIAPLSNLIPVSLDYQPPLANQKLLFKDLPQVTSEETTSCPSSLLTPDQYAKLVEHIHATQVIKGESKLGNAPVQYEWKWRTIYEGLENALQSESCLAIFPCSFEELDLSIEIGFYMASPQAATTGKTLLQPSQICMFYIVDGQIQFLRNQIYLVIELHNGALTLEARLDDDGNQYLGPVLFKYAPDLKASWMLPLNLCRADPCPRKDVWIKLIAANQKVFTPGPVDVCAGYPFYHINKLQPSYSANISAELIENTTPSDVYLVPKNLSLSTFIQALFQDSPEAVKFLQIKQQQNGEVLKPNTRINDNISTLRLSSTLHEIEVLKHLSASPCQTLQRILDHHHHDSEQVEKPIPKFLNVLVENTLPLFEELGRTMKLQNPNFLRKYAAVLHQHGAYINTLQTILGESFISSMIDFLLEGPPCAKSAQIFSLTLLSHIKFADTFSVTSNQLFEALSGLLSSISSESNYLKDLLEHLHSASSQIFFLYDPRVFQSFMNAVLWRTDKDISQLKSLVCYDNNILTNVLTNDLSTIEEEKGIWGQILLIDPRFVDIERLRAYQILERWTLIFQKLPDQTKSQKLACEVLKILKAGIYESLIKFRLPCQSKRLFNAFSELCNRKLVETPQIFFKNTQDNISMLFWTKSVAQEFLKLKFEEFNYPLFLEVMTLPLAGLKFAKSLLVKNFDSLEAHKVAVFLFFEFLRQIGSREYLQEKFYYFDVNEFYEQWAAAAISLNTPKTLMKILYVLLKDTGLFFLEVLELLHGWSENKILVNIFKFEFAEALDNCQDENAPPNLESFLVSLMRNLAQGVKEEPGSQKKPNVVQIASKALVIIQKIRTNVK